MLCPRCSLKLPKNTLVCARCGEETPRPTGFTVDTRPPADGPRFAPALGREIPLDRRQRGVRAVSPPLRVRPLAPAFARGDERETPRRHLRAVPPAADLPTDGSGALQPALPSIVHQAKTQPDWHQEPVDSTPPEVLEVEDADVSEELPAPLAARAGAALVDAGVVVLTLALAAVASAVAFGPARLAPFLERGPDYVVDGLLLGQGLGLYVVAFAATLAFAYATLAHALVGATFGKRVFGLRVVDRDGLVPGFGESLARTCATVVSLVPGGVGYAFALFDRRRLALHDRLVGTRVVRD